MTEPLTLKARTTATPEQVFQALTTVEGITTWLADKANVELPVRYEFWGSSVPEGDAPHQRLVSATGNSLHFTWLLDGEETTTGIEVGSEDGDTTITLTQSHFDFNDVLTGASIRGVLQTFWALALANLVDHVEGREITARPDFTRTDFSTTVTIDASAEEVFDSLISSEKVSAWFGFPFEIEPYVDGRYAMGGFDNAPHPAKIVDLVPGERLSVDWGPSGVATWELEGTGGKTRLTMMNSGFDTTNPPYAGWIGNLSGLAELRRFHDIADWRPIWIES
ncbi:ATPase [Prauserella marina]|uniref:Uncharacterized conserved protein YndB, AHSA1/START domain n=1 Tax=Prauserella marina TaxID=530584 RepID=A0A222VNW0_9PSEU|nr:SRPBCC family protein [Prauserella marina]ASR35542.1 ATPase [Prauserella marina]PWV84618.1 uncharacterized protein YndB with AHSA1/START domain [Prauserella marina]SDC17552.1 Uncharacterized conserved protein YndB, AHSA1/START domain [Prauserella marina]